MGLLKIKHGKVSDEKQMMPCVKDWPEYIWFWCLCTKLINTTVGQNKGCSVGAKCPPLSTLVVTEIRLWTLTPCVLVCVCVCFWMCVFCTVTQVFEVEMVSSSRGCLFCWWLKPLADEKKAIWLSEMSDSVSCAIRDSPSAPSPVVFLHATWTNLDNNHDLIDRSAECHFQQPVSHISTWSLPVIPLSSRWWSPSSSTAGNAPVSWKGEERELTGWISLNSRCVLHFQDIPNSLPCIILVGYLWQSCATGLM